MPTRHRIPTVFTLYMVDVLCCALGCVILLWFLKLHEARHHLAEARSLADAARTTGERLKLTEDERDRLRRDRDAATSDRDALRAKIAQLDKDRSELADRLAKKIRDQELLAKDLTSAKDRTVSLETLLREKDASMKAAARSADDLAARLRDADARFRSSQEKLSTLEARSQSLEKEIGDRKRDLAGASKGMEALQETNRSLLKDIELRNQQLIASDRVIDSLRLDKKNLLDENARVRIAVENRFAGIALTGRRVVFLVDMSGSMDLVDERTPAADKWLGVRETLAKVMRSLPQLEKFQVILFSDKATYLLGNDGGWLDFNPKVSADLVLQRMAAVKPKGSTNMYTALETAFRYRATGLDTIYLLSDGLPNLGEGLSPDVAGSLKETERTEVLSQHVRKTLKAQWNRNLISQPRVRINTIGFFYESPDVGAFLWALARENDGSFVGMSKP